LIIFIGLDGEFEVVEGLAEGCSKYGGTFKNDLLMKLLKLPQNETVSMVPGDDPVAADYNEAHEFNKRGLFVGGCQKSGTTLLMSLLDGHPQLVVLPEETHYLEERRKYTPLKSYPARLELLLQNLSSLGSGDCCDTSPGCAMDARNYSQFDYRLFVGLARDFIDKPWMNDSLLFSETIRAYGIALGADWQNCAGWVEKTTKTESYARLFDQLFPDARLIQIVRDPRAVFASLKNRILNRHGCFTKAHRLPRMWNRSAREIPRLRRDPSRFLVVRYEDLVANPRKIMEGISRFGRFQFNERLLEPTRAGGDWEGNSAFYKSFDGVCTAPAEKWKEYLTEDEIWWIELHCRRGMQLAGYALQTNARFSFRRWLKRLPDESWHGYFRSRRASLFQGLGLLKECRYDA
jgi:hypothetical protein